MLQVVAAVATLALFGVLAVHFSEVTPETPVRRFSFAHEGLGLATISPDGRHIVFVVRSDGLYSLWLRSLGSETAHQLPGTEDVVLTRRGTSLAGAWSPDSQSIVFPADDQLKRLSISGGEPVRLCELPATGQFRFRGASWSPDGARIVFSSDGKLWEVPARGGDPRILLEGSEVYFWHP